jgi:hypothetical protein
MVANKNNNKNRGSIDILRQQKTNKMKNTLIIINMPVALKWEFPSLSNLW